MPYGTEAYVVHEPGGDIALEDIVIDDVLNGEVLVDIVAFSVCATDLKAAAGKFLLKPPMVLGHEAAGIVSQASPSSIYTPGTKVILTFSSCGQCPQCTTGSPSYCADLGTLNFSGRRKDGSTAIGTTDGKDLNGFFFGHSSMGRQALVREESLVKVPDDTTVEQLRMWASLGCGLQTGAGTILNVTRPSPSSRIVIIGSGAVGAAAGLAALTTSPAQIILVDTSSAKFDLLPSELNARASDPEITHLDSSSLASPGALASKLQELTSGAGPDCILDCVGAPALIEEAIPALAARGMAVTVGGGAPGAAASVRLLDMLIKGRTWRGTHQGDSEPKTFLPQLINLQQQGLFPFDKLLTYYKFDELHKAIDDIKEGRVLKAVLVVQ